MVGEAVMVHHGVLVQRLWLCWRLDGGGWCLCRPSACHVAGQGLLWVLRGLCQLALIPGAFSVYVLFVSVTLERTVCSLFAL